MVTLELFIDQGFEDALNIDRDSFNELNPHYIRVQSYVHALLHERIFPETWSEEKTRNEARRKRQGEESESTFIDTFEKVTGDNYATIQRTAERSAENKRKKPQGEEPSPVSFNRPKKTIEVDKDHPLTKKVLSRKRYARLAEQIIVAFERANLERSPTKRREMFYKLLTEIFAAQ
jgi:hypothetical protein